MAGSDKQKQSLYFPEETLLEIMRQANRLDRSLSWTVQQAWRLAREEIRRFPAINLRSDPVRPPQAVAARPQPPVDARHIGDDDPAEMSPQLRDFLKGKFDRGLSN